MTSTVLLALPPAMPAMGGEPLWVRGPRMGWGELWHVIAQIWKVYGQYLYN